MADETQENGAPKKIVEKGALQSKKFIAFLLCEFGFFFLMAMMLMEQEMDKLGENVAFMVLAVTAGFGMVGYCLGQSFIDRYVRAATIMAGKGDDGTSS